MLPLDWFRSPEDILASLCAPRARRRLRAQDVRALAPLAGISRISELSGLTRFALPVVQSVRLGLATHRAFGGFSGSHGRGSTRAGAEIGAMLEAVELAAAEPRNAVIVRASHRALQRAHPVMNPKSFTQVLGARPVGLDEPILWARAASLTVDAPAWIPAETVFFPIYPDDWATRSHFPQSSVGLACGATLADAVVHGLFEVLERHAAARWEKSSRSAEALDPCEALPASLARVLRRVPGARVLLLLFELGEGRSALPVVQCILSLPEARYLGIGVAPSIDGAVTRAVTEALQAVAQRSSGTRENMSLEDRTPVRACRSRRPLALRVRPMAQLRARFPLRRARNARELLPLLLRAARAAGCPHVFAANLTRVGLEIPTVRVVVAGALVPQSWREPCSYTTAAVQRRQFGAA